MNARKRFHYRSFTSFLLLWTFLALIVSGAVLYVAPPGRIANWTRWQLVVLTKEQWQAVHTLTAIMFLTGGLFHLLKFNWHAIMTYLRRKSESRAKRRYEMAASAVLFLLVIAGTIAQKAPFQTVMNAGASLRQSWEDPARVPPIPHMEEMTLREFAGNIQMEPDRLIQSLQTLGYKATNQEEPLQQLARRHETSPVQIYTALLAQGKTPAAGHQPAGGGRGQGFKTLAQLAAEYGLTSDAAIRNLAAKGIRAGSEDRMRDIADHSGKKPYEVIEILRGSPGK